MGWNINGARLMAGDMEFSYLPRKKQDLNVLICIMKEMVPTPSGFYEN